MRCEDKNGVSDTVLASFDQLVPVIEGAKAEMIFPGLTIKVKECVVLRDNIPIHLNYSEFMMLYHLARYPKVIFTKDQLYDAVYGEDHLNSNTVPNTICRIRKKIEPNPKQPIYIKTVIGMGYKFDMSKWSE